MPPQHATRSVVERRRIGDEDCHRAGIAEGHASLAGRRATMRSDQRQASRCRLQPVATALLPSHAASAIASRMRVVSSRIPRGHCPTQEFEPSPAALLSTIDGDAFVHSFRGCGGIDRSMVGAGSAAADYTDKSQKVDGPHLSTAPPSVTVNVTNQRGLDQEH